MKRLRGGSLRWFAVLCAILVVLSCYWTPSDEEGELTVEISTHNLGTSQLGGYDGLFYGWVIAEDLIRNDGTAADQAFGELNAALDEALIELERTESLADFAVDLAFPSIQLQASVFTGTSGSHTFSGLRADRDYLLCVEAYDFVTDSEGVGFTTATVSAGETKLVRVDVTVDWVPFFRFLEQRYGMGFGPATIEIVDTVGYFSTDGPLYVDLLSGDSADPDFNFDSWYSTVRILDSDGNSIPKSGSRPGIPTEASTYLIAGLEPNRYWRVLITDWADRTSTLGAEVYWVSRPFTAFHDEIYTLYLDADFADIWLPQ